MNLNVLNVMICVLLSDMWCQSLRNAYLYFQTILESVNIPRDVPKDGVILPTHNVVPLSTLHGNANCVARSIACIGPIVA